MCNALIIAYFYINNRIIILEDEKMIVDSKYNELVLKIQELKKNQLDLLGASKTEERNRIARDLHDSVGHLLSTLSIQLTALEKITKSRDLDISENIGELKNFTQDGLREVKKIIHDMKVEDNSWKDNIEKLINNSGIKINYIVNEETWKLNERQEQAIYRIIQEFITNSQKYANTNKINISLIFSEDSLVLSMRDFGKGCEKLEEKGGLLSIRERVNELHGKMNVESGNNKGFYLQVYIPRVI
ncbi:sensor histidine kinase [uncultured Parvimonas sp.]|uniref:sensor histidine kinase n=1 Tax=uncultured Parvimonas sp. TaxID=747372 RepID=UPI0028D23820|nr:sensor histidine kinase [uncultured Parvimonas sp.]